MKIHNRQDFLAALMFLAFGIFFLYFAQDYGLGTARRMGPGYFPSLLSALLIVLGLIILGLSLWSGNPQEEEIEKTDWRGLVLVLGSVLVFAQLLPVAGFLIAGPILVLLAGLGSHEMSWKERVGLTVVLTSFCILVFRFGLEMQFPILPPSLAN